jgi:hypothetical protein
METLTERLPSDAEKRSSSLCLAGHWFLAAALPPMVDALGRQHEPNSASGNTAIQNDIRSWLSIQILWGNGPSKWTKKGERGLPKRGNA